MRRLPIAAMAILLALVVGCAQETPSARTSDAGAPAPQSAVSAAGGSPGGDAAAVPAANERALITTASVDLEGADPWVLGDRIKAIALGLGGDLLDLSQRGSGTDRFTTVTFRVPADRFDEALARIGQLDAKVVSSRVSTKDVTDQFVDLQARLAARQAEERSYLALLARADKIEDILKIDQQLGTVRLQIEQLQGQINSIKSRTTYSTIVVTIGTAGLATPAPWDPARTIADASAALVGLVQLIGDLAIWLVIVGWVPALGVAAVVLLRRRFRRPPTARSA